MSTRALLALMVLLGTLAFPTGVAEVPGRAPAGPSSFYLNRTDIPPNGLVPFAPADGWVDLANNTTTEFRLAGFAGLYDPSGNFTLDLSIASLNFSGLRLAFAILLDANGDGTAEAAVHFQGCTTFLAKQTEHVSRVADNVTGTVGDLNNGTVRLLINRTDTADGLLRVFCGGGDNSSTLRIPYGAPLMASAGPDRQSKVNQTIPFNASASRTVDKAHTQYIWDFDSSDGLGTDAADVNAEHSYALPGAYNVTLTLTLGGYLDRDTMVVTVIKDIPPIAEAGWNITQQRRGVPIPFHGSGQDPDGTVVSYEWFFGDGANSSGQNVTHAYTAPGDYTVTLVVRDNDGSYGTDTARVHINSPPYILSMGQRPGASGMTFTAKASDPDGNDTILRYEWDFGDGATGTGVSPTHHYNSTGTFRVVCTVFDPLGDNATDSINVSITNSAPVITTLGGLKQVNMNEFIHFKPYAYDPDGDNLSYSWNFGDGTTSHEPEPYKSYKSAGNYHVILDVSDGQATTCSTMDITVNETGSATDAATTVAGMACLALIGIVVVAALVWAISRKRPEPAPNPYFGYPGAPPLAPSPGYGAPPPAPFQGYGAPQPMYQPPPPRAYVAPSAPAASACPRCGSRDLTVFGDGHAKCNNCKKILYTG